MLRRRLKYGLSLFAFLLVGAAHADVEYWISVGSYRQLSAAEQARSEASMRLPESFSVTPAETDTGTWYRVLAGPYLTREIADHMVGESRRQGFENAWILAADAGTIAAPLYANDPLYSSDLLLESQDYDLEYPSLSPAASDPTDAPGYEAPDRADRGYKLVDKAPPDYQLNQLHRQRRP